MESCPYIPAVMDKLNFTHVSIDPFTDVTYTGKVYFFDNERILKVCNYGKWETRIYKYRHYSYGTVLAFKAITRSENVVSVINVLFYRQTKSSDLTWEDYFMALACVAARRSKDPCKKVGACIVNEDRRVVALGYNGMPNGCSDDEMPWGKEGKWEDTKYPYVCHAEMNAIMNKTSADLKNCILYTTKFPCNECAKLIIQAGITNVYYINEVGKTDNKEITASKLLLDKAKVQYSPHVSQAKIVIDLSTIQ